MDFKNKFDALRHIKLGINEVFYYNYDGEPLPLRPISSYELDDCFHKALKYANEKVFNVVVKSRLQLIDRSQENEDFNIEDYYSLQRYYDAISYWIVYHSMKKFQNEDFTIPIIKDNEIIPKGLDFIRQMNHIHEIAQIVTRASNQPKEVVKEIISDNSGKEIAYCVFYLNAPLASYPDLTKLQRDYLVYSKGELIGSTIGADKTELKKKQYIISGQKMTIADVIKKFYGRDILENVQKEFDEKGEADTPFGHIKIDEVKKRIEEAKDADSR